MGIAPYHRQAARERAAVMRTARADGEVLIAGSSEHDGLVAHMSRQQPALRNFRYWNAE